MHIAHLVNLYPLISYSFIRREITALEAYGVGVSRFSIRRCNEELIDPADQRELERTRVILSVGAAGLLLGHPAVSGF